ncbi:aldehyde ferredoxin oxidoreductase C-terminal domain-containing protein [Desulforhopalus singaporensis]|uniref:Aldehyde:ferredoxin oxidoreductase n=1 Tax=Desulforhopalus singaporensis TaxID=91360 RepID=A0A1H0LW88_9BACT|nr:aldehyde ferredoxin oxidoreductase C-terminal domain-containing protein [Desulforhopalus singaporensis]SDO72363.1 aldehyde:ferredoxin oxidoreductase [Desulforhopalus singaporensis]
MKFLRVDMTAQTAEWQDVPQEYEKLGGRALTSLLVDSEVSATADPLTGDNKLVFAPGYFSGTTLVNSSRLSVGAKSPLTGGIKESNVGGTVAYSLARLGVKAVVVEGQAADGKYFYLNIESDTAASLVPCDQLKGMRTYALTQTLHGELGTDKSVTCIGPAGDQQLLSASIQSTDLDGRPCRAAGRGGLGAVMGSKGLKAIVVDRNGKKPVPLADDKRFKDAARAYAKDVKADEFSGEILPELGTAVLVEPINAAGAFPTRNARQGQFENVDKISGEAIAKVIKERGGKNKHKGCAQCIVDCSNEFVTAEGEFVTSSLEYETIWSMGGMIGNDDIDAIARLDFLCDDIGLDTMNTGVALAVAFDAGYAEFGDAKKAISLVEQVAEGTEMGRLIGNGPHAVGEHFNHDRVPAVKKQSMAAYDPRAIQGMAVTYATTPMGADHTAGWVVDQNLEAFGGTVDARSGEGQVEISRATQIHMAAVDSVGICDFAQSGLASEEGIGNVYTMMSAKSGDVFGEAEWAELGSTVLRTELGFNKRAGLTEEDYQLPEMFYKEPLPPYNVVVKVTREQMNSTFEDL